MSGKTTVTTTTVSAPSRAGKKSTATASAVDELASLALAAKEMEDEERAKTGSQNSFITLLKANSGILDKNSPAFIKGVKVLEYAIPSKKLRLGAKLDATIIGMVKIYAEVAKKVKESDYYPKFEIAGRNYKLTDEGKIVISKDSGLDAEALKEILTRSKEVQEDYKQMKLVARRSAAALFAPRFILLVQKTPRQGCRCIQTVRKAARWSCAKHNSTGKIRHGGRILPPTACNIALTDCNAVIYVRKTAPLVRPNGAELRSFGAELRSFGVELRSFGVELRSFGVELRNPDAGVRNPAPAVRAVWAALPPARAAARPVPRAVRTKPRAVRNTEPAVCVKPHGRTSTARTGI